MDFRRRGEALTLNSAPFIADKTSVQQGYVTSEPFAIEREGGFRPKLFLAADYGYRSYSTTIAFVTHSVYESVCLATRIVLTAARPGRIVEEIPIDPDPPRHQDLRIGAAYLELCQRASRALAGAAAETSPRDGSQSA